MEKIFSYKAAKHYETTIAVLTNLFIVLILLESIDVIINMRIFVLVFMSSVISMLWWKLLFKKPYILLIIAVVALTSVYILEKYYEEIYTLCINKLDDFIAWAIRYISGLTFILEDYLIALTIIVTFLLALINYILVLKNKRTFVLTILGTALFAYEWFQFLDNAILYYGVFIFLVMLLNTIRKYKENKSLWESENKRIAEDMFKRIIINNFIVCALVILVSFVLPKEIEPISWRWLDDKARETFPGLVNWRNTQKGSSSYGIENVFDLSFTQFQNNPKRLGGPVRVNNELLMEVRSDSPVYLRGRVKDFYTGSYWKETKNHGNMQYPNTRISFTQSGHSKYDGKGVTITHKNFTTSTIFTPLIPRTIVFDEKYYYATNEFELYTNDIIMNDQSYTVYYYNPAIDMDVISESSYIHDKEITKYLQLPDTVTDATFKLAEKITGNIKGDYFKAKALENYLKSSFVYTLNPSETPYNKDFVEYFLFELKEGYCTYFASSMVVLARCAGIPARYVEGFRAADKNEYGRYDVYSSNAHAWAEVYIEGYGWMTFEPTPGYSNTWMNEQQVIEEEQAIEVSTVKDTPIRRNNALDILDEFSISNIDNEYNLEQSQENERISLVEYLLYILGILILLIVSIVVYFLVVSNRNRKYMDNNSRIINYYEYAQRLLDKLDKSRMQSETTYEYYNRFDLNELSELLKKLTDTFNKARYSNEKISSEEIEDVNSVILEFEKYIKKKIGFKKFAVVKLIKLFQQARRINNKQVEIRVFTEIKE